MIIVVIADAARIWVKTLRAGGHLPTFEVPKVASRLVAPAGLIVTDEDRAIMATAGDTRFTRADEREPARTGGSP
jgi:carbon starvation protein